jgi:hypothetical protein
MNEISGKFCLFNFNGNFLFSLLQEKFATASGSEDITQKLTTCTAKIVQLVDQNSKLHVALKNAKKHILSQDKNIKDFRVANPRVRGLFFFVLHLICAI